MMKGLAFYLGLLVCSKNSNLYRDAWFLLRMVKSSSQRGDNLSHSGYRVDSVG